MKELKEEKKRGRDLTANEERRRKGAMMLNGKPHDTATFSTTLFARIAYLRESTLRLKKFITSRN